MLSVEKVGGANSLYGTEFRGKTADMASILTDEVVNGSTFYNMETSQTYMFDAEAKRWLLQRSGGGGTGGVSIYIWTANSSYNVDDLVIYDNDLYRCVTANSDSSWTPSHWTAISSADGNYEIVEHVSDLPSTFISTDRKIYFVIDESIFYLWNGVDWEAQSTSIESITIAEIDSLFD